ncbi:SgcJ/EcaC family oxidoreductase [Actinoplanes sp. N902-109]|uniref:SgcJ/EcaC family oxidoreductase n=1 Tax=Actinoplanes sp. (strain N902-109) TaxID=649831 RepID=UPI00032966CB|nr:SgcJ/EcaC family oxidoreductase [Actinoplanes sp. N902-109]AGL16704.1 hypothetical protein L083_3194 [Actinoplanes sp. N902-109]
MSAGWGDATALLAGAGVPEDTGYYRGFTAPDEKAVLTVAMRIQAAWAANDADAFAGVFTADGSLLMQDTQLRSREEIRDYMTRGFAGGLKGARVLGGPVHVGFLTPDVAMVVTEGGIVRPGGHEVAPADRIRATWVITRRDDGTPALVSHQSSPVHG